MRRCSLFGPLVLAALSAGGPVLADSIEDGQAAYNQRDYATALKLWQPLAEQGNARAQNNLGVMYENGKGVPQDISQAMKWYRLAAEQGYAGAQNNLGMIYAIGRAVPHDPLRAYMWFSLAASSLSGEVGQTVTQTRDVFASAMTASQIAQANQMAQTCKDSNYKQCEPDSAAIAADPSLVASPVTPALPTTPHEVTLADYPQYSLRAHEAGVVTVTYTVNEVGSVTNCSVVLTSGNSRLDDAACAMVKRRWKYKPATQDGKPVSIQYISKVEFPRR